MAQTVRLSRRRLLEALAYVGASSVLGHSGRLLAQPSRQPQLKPIPASGEAIPVIGMGTWVTFNVEPVKPLRDHRADILRVFFENGGRVIDSSPMYGAAEDVVGYCLEHLDNPPDPFAATKVWTRLGGEASGQMQNSRRLWGVEVFDLMQVHNLVNWREHLKTLRAEKEAGRIRYIGVTTSHGRRHDELEKVMRSEPLDFVQMTYNITHREAENRLLPLAADRGIAVIANRPFAHKQLFYQYQDHPLPPWAEEIDCANWAQFFLKFIVSHPAVTCAIPATSQIPHMHENMGALYGPMPDQAMRQRMVDYIEGL